MLNLIGELPASDDLLRIPGAHLHLYDKAPRPGRKLGHVTMTAADQDLLAERLRDARSATPSPEPAADQPASG